MSLRARLLLALIVVALVALVVTDGVTYSSLRSFLYSQGDQSLVADHVNIERVLGGTSPIPTSQSLLATAPGTFAEVKHSDGTVIAGPVAAYEQGKKYTPRLPETITGFETARAGGEATVAFNTSSNESGGPTFRVRVWQLAGGDELILGTPLGRVAATLHHLLLWEIAVTAGTLLVALFLGWWLMLVGLRPLTAIERTADTIAAGRVRAACSRRGQKDRSRPLGKGPQRHAWPDSGGVRRTRCHGSGTTPLGSATTQICGRRLPRVENSGRSGFGLCRAV